MVQPVDVVTLLVKCGVGNGQVCIKPDLSLENRLNESILLKKMMESHELGHLNKY